MPIEIDKKRRMIKKVNDNTYLYDFIETQGFYFSKEILTRYFLSLRTKPFVILTGISGTGKTKIAQLFADYILQDYSNKEKHKAFIPVKPDWMDNKGLFGFYNILDQKYSSTKFLQIILDALENPEEPYFIILDEMNLSKVEMYFSDLLSIMETRTQDNEEGEAIPLHSLSQVQSLEGTEIPSEILIPRNVFIAGTVNVDETTYMFSPKVLDRANVIEFNEVDLKAYEGFSPRKEDRFYLKNQDIKDKLIDPQEQPFCSRNDYLKVREILGDANDPMDKLLKILQKYTLHFGYRVINEMSRFIWLSKEYLGERFDFNEAFDIQILQKILPKFHGTQAKLEQPLRDILAFCYGEKPIEFDNEFIEEASVSADGARYVRTAKKLARMISNLQSQGYTSFIE
ncbi:MAG: AAA family ATPase [Proteobacteria bacterium]|nr:AAA family ATPase [Pseudomonadota bacterium]